MTKKASDIKHNKKLARSLEAEELNRYLVVGNHYMARILAKRMARNNAELEADRVLAEYALCKTHPDTGALLAGLACFVVIAISAFIVAY